MPLTDLPLELLRDFAPEVDEPRDFDEFWTDTLAEARAAGPAVDLAPAQSPFTEIEFLDLTFPGFGGEPIKGWVSRPRSSDEPRPVVVEYLGYNGGRGLPGERPHWAMAGFVHVLMDTRGQGSGWGSGGDTPDPHGSDAAGSGWMTKGISDPHDYFYRRMFTDAVRAVDAARTLPFADPSRTFVTGGSQGGGTALAVAGLVPDLAGAMPDVPFLCAFRRSVDLTDHDPFSEIARYLAVHRDQDEAVFRTLSYFDGVNFAKRATAPGLFSVALMDNIVLPSTVFAAYNRYAHGDRDIAVYPFNGHEGGGLHQLYRQIAWAAARA